MIDPIQLEPKPICDIRAIKAVSNIIYRSMVRDENIRYLTMNEVETAALDTIQRLGIGPIN